MPLDFSLHPYYVLCVCACVFFPIILDVRIVGGHTGGRSHWIFFFSLFNKKVKFYNNAFRFFFKPILCVLGDQEPCTADQGCRIVSVEFVVLLSSLSLTCRVGVLTESQYYSSLNLNTDLGGTKQEL